MMRLPLQHPRFAGLRHQNRRYAAVDDTDCGFDNIADVLSIPPVLLGRCTSSAQECGPFGVRDSSIEPDLHV